MNPRKFMINRILSLLGLGVAACAIIGLAKFPSENNIVNVLGILCAALIAFKEINDLIINHFAEKAYYKMLDAKQKANQAKEEE